MRGGQRGAAECDASGCSLINIARLSAVRLNAACVTVVLAFNYSVTRSGHGERDWYL